MKTNFDIEEIVESGLISNELDYERVLIADRKLRLLAKEILHFKKLRFKLRDLIEKYRKAKWSNVEQIDEDKLLESDKSERIAESERVFLETRKQSIRKKLKEFELMNGIKPFTLKDLIIINRLLKIEITVLIPLFLGKEDQTKVKEAVKKLDKLKVKLTSDDLVLS